MENSSQKEVVFSNGSNGSAAAVHDPTSPMAANGSIAEVEIAENSKN